MNKQLMIIAIATGAVAAYLLLRKKRRDPIQQYEPAIRHQGNAVKHLTGVFSRAKVHGM